MKYTLFAVLCWSLLLVGCDSGRNPVDGVVIYDFDFDLDPDVDVDVGGGGSGGSGGGGGGGFGGSPPGTLPPRGSVACNTAGLGGLHQLSFFKDARQKKILELSGFGGLSLDGAANAYVVETSANNESNLVKYDRLGKHVWQRSLGFADEKLSVGTHSDQFGRTSTYLTRFSGADGSDTDVEITSYDHEGLEKWRRTISSPMNDVGLVANADTNGNMIVAGFTEGTLENYIASSHNICDIEFLGSNSQWTLNEDDGDTNQRLCRKSTDSNCDNSTYSVKTSDNQSTHGKPLHKITFFENSTYKFVKFSLYANQHGADNITITRTSDNCEKTFELVVNRKNDDPLTNSAHDINRFTNAGDNFTCDHAKDCLDTVLNSVDAGLVGNNTLTNISSDNWSVSEIENTYSDNNTVVITPNGRWWFQPDRNFNGRQYFSVKVFDNDGHNQDKRICVASVTHESENSTPILRCQNQLANTKDNVFAYSINEGDNLTKAIYAHDQNNQPIDFRILEGFNPSYGSIQSGNPTSVLNSAGVTCFDNSSDIHLYNCGSAERVDYRPDYQQYEDYGYARIKEPDNSTDNITKWQYKHSLNPNDYSDYITNDSTHKYYEFKVRFTDQTGFYNDAIIQVKVQAVNDTPVTYDNNTLASEHVEETDIPAPLDMSYVDSNCGDGYCDNWNNTASERNKIIFQGSDIEDTIDNLTFYLHGTSGCTKATCYIDGSNGSTGFSNRNKRQLVINPYNNLSYAVYTDRRQFKVHDGGKYGIYNNSGNLAQSSDIKHSSVKQISLTLFGLNDQPVADNLSANVSEGVQNSITLRGSDIDRDDKIEYFTITTLPDPKFGLLRKQDNTTINLNETVAATSNQAIIYFTTHDNLSAGAATDTFTYTATDNSSTTKSDLRQPDVIYNEPKESDNATVQLTIYGANDRPTAGAVSDNLTEDVSKGTILSFSDIDANDSASYYTITSLPTRGNINVSGTTLANSNLPYNLPVGTNSVTVSPHQSLAKNQTYSDSFNYTVTDNSSSSVLHLETHDNRTSAASTVSLTITGANDAPVANNANQGNFGFGQATKNFSLTCSDVDGDSTSYILKNNLEYTPIASFDNASGSVSLSTHSFTISNVAFRENLVFQCKDVHNTLSENATITFDALGPGCIASTMSPQHNMAKEPVNTDAFLAKYDSEGTPLWARQVGSPAEDVSMGTTTDLFGNILLTGYTSGELTEKANAGNLDIFLVKFNSSGRELWRRQFGSLGDDVVLAITTDESGNIYLTGQTGGNLDGHQNTGGIDLFVVKYDTGGSLQWSQQWGTSGHDLGAKISVDVQGRLNLLGLKISENQNTEVEYFYSRLDSSTGSRLWTLPLETEAAGASGLALDYTGNAFLAQPPSSSALTNTIPVLEYRPN